MFSYITREMLLIYRLLTIADGGEQLVGVGGQLGVGPQVKDILLWWEAGDGCYFRAVYHPTDHDHYQMNSSLLGLDGFGKPVGEESLQNGFDPIEIKLYLQR